MARLASGKGLIRSAKRDGGKESDPYLMRNPPLDRAICRQCHAIYHHKHWILDENIYHEMVKGNGVAWDTCPGCQKIADHYPMGVVQLRGNYMRAHKDEIINLVHNEEERARGFNPLERIYSIQDLGDRIEIETTNEKLAQRIGRRLRRAHQGEVHFKWSGDNKFIRVEWERSLPPKR